MAAPGGSDTLPEHCSYGVCEDGRVFFIDDRNRSTSWLHPRSQDPINTGHMIRSDLPPGWEEGFTEEGASFFIDHNQRRTTFCHPVTGETSPENHEFDLREEEILLAPQQPMSQRPCSMVSETSTAVSGSTAEPRPAAKAPKPAGKVYSFGKRAQSIKRNQSAPVVARGWLHKQDSSGMHLWKRRWFLLSDFCLFYYKDSREEAVLGSIPLPGYWISPTDPEDRVNRKHSFKAVHTGMRAYIQQQEHSGMRTYYFSADTQEDLNGWMKAMNQAAQMESAPTAKRSSEEMDWQLAPDHMDPTKEYSKLENLQTNNNHQRPDDLYFVRKHEDPRMELVEDQYTLVMVNAEGGTSNHVVTNDYYESKAPYLPSKHEDLKPERFEDRYASITANSKGGTSKQFFSNDQHKPKALYLPSKPEDLKPETLEQDCYTSLTKSGPSKHFVSSNHHKPKEPYFSTQQDDLRSEPVEGDRYASLTVNTKSGLSKHFVSSDHHKPKEPYFSRKPEVPRPQLVEEDCYTFQKLNSKVPTSKQFSSSAAESAFTEFSKEYRSQSAQPQSFERNGTLPSSFSMSASPVKQNGMDKQGFVQRAAPEKQVQRRSNMAQVEQWVKIQKGDTKSAVSDHTLPRQYNHPPHYTERYQTLPKTRQPSASSPPPSRNLPSDYKYAHDRVNHFKMSNQERKATKDGMVWQLYEWQQRQQFKHGSPTGPINMNTLGYTDRNRSKSFLDVPRCISVPPSPSDIPPAAAPPKAYTLRRSHTPAERVTVRPEDLHGGSPPPKSHLDVVKSAAHVDRRSMPMPGYMTHTVSAPSLHGKSADDTYLQMKKDLEYLDLKVTGRETLKERSWKPVRIAESDIDVKLSILCEQDRILQELEDKIRALKDNKDKLETVLEVLHRQMDQYKDQPQHTEKISSQQRLLQEDLVQIRAEMSKVSSDMENSWNEYLRLESDVSQLRQNLQKQMKRSPSSQEKTQMQKDLWRIEDVTAGLSANKLNYSALVESFKNPERKTVPLTPSQLVPSGNTVFTSIRSKSLSPLTRPLVAKPTSDIGLFSQSFPQTRSSSQPQLLQKSDPLPHSPIWVTTMRRDEDAPPRPPLPDIYSPNDPEPPPNIPPPPALPPPPRESSIIRHTSVRGLKRQSDERKRDRELGQGLNGDHKADLCTYVSDPDTGLDYQQMPGLLSSDSGYQTLPGRGLSGSTSRLPQSSSVTSYVTLRRGASSESSKERPISAFERLYSGDDQRGKMSAEEQLQRMKRHQKALVRERKRTLSQGDKQSMMSQSTSRPVSADISSWKREQDFDLQLLERAARDVDDRDEDKWMKVKAVQIMELNLDPEEYEFDISKELSMPDKVAIPERYVEMEPEEPLSTDEVEARQRKVQKIKNILARSSVHNLQPAEYPVEADLDSHWEEQERMITISHALASEASLRSKQVAAHAVTEY